MTQKRILAIISSVFLLSLLVIMRYASIAESAAESAGAPSTQDHLKETPAASLRYGGGTLNESEQAGAEIWFKATAGNERFFTYVYPQRLGVAIDWYRFLSATSRESRFNK
ncbi:MAG: hypothetical protein AAB300_04155 [Nitrospirota bacterium]